MELKLIELLKNHIRSNMFYYIYILFNLIKNLIHNSKYNGSTWWPKRFDFYYLTVIYLHLITIFTYLLKGWAILVIFYVWKRGVNYVSKNFNFVMI